MSTGHVDNTGPGYTEKLLMFYLHEVGVIAQDGPCDLLVILQQVI